MSGFRFKFFPFKTAKKKQLKLILKNLLNLGENFTNFFVLFSPPRKKLIETFGGTLRVVKFDQFSGFLFV